MQNDRAITEMLSRFGRYAIPAPNQQLHFARQVRAWLDWCDTDGPCPPNVQRRGIRAKQRLVEGNLRLVVSVANRFKRVWYGHPERFEDLIQEGVIGLNRAIELFDPTRGYSFATYAVWWIRQAMSRASDSLLAPIRVPEGAAQTWYKLSKLISNHEAEHGYRPSIEWLAAETGLSRPRIERSIVVGRVRATASLDEAIQSGDETAGALLDCITYEDDSDPDDGLQEQLQRDTIDRLTQQLAEADQQLLRDIYSEGLNHAEVARQLGCCRETARKRGRIAVSRLKQLVAAEQQLPIAG